MAVFRFPPYPQQPPPRVIQDTEVAVDNPPFGQRLRVLAGLALVVATWQPSPVLPQLQNKVTVSIPTVSEDNPPFSQRSVLPDILRAWQPASPPPQRSSLLPVIITAVPEDNPPFGVNSSRSIILRAWVPRLDVPILRGSFTQTTTDITDNPPFSQRRTLSTILRTWELAPPLLVRGGRFPQEAGAIVADTPPLAHGGRNVLTAVILAQWQPDYRRQNQQGSHVPVALSAVSEDNPPFSQRRTLSTILRTWEPAPPLLVRGGRFPQEAVRSFTDRSVGWWNERRESTGLWSAHESIGWWSERRESIGWWRDES